MSCCIDNAGGVICQVPNVLKISRLNIVIYRPRRCLHLLECASLIAVSHNAEYNHHYLHSSIFTLALLKDF